ncbi:hypothetical protein AMTRI_Chr03g148050 [Amborella trichopoda]
MIRAKTQLSMPQDLYIHTYIHTYKHYIHYRPTNTHIRLFCSCDALSNNKSALPPLRRDALLPPKGGVRSFAFVHSRVLQLFLGAKPNSQ